MRREERVRGVGGKSSLLDFVFPCAVPEAFGSSRVRFLRHGDFVFLGLGNSADLETLNCKKKINPPPPVSPSFRTSLSLFCGISFSS